METLNNIDKLPLLLKAVEHTMGHTMATPRHFQLLSESLYNRTRQQLSVSTLKRLWGYVHNAYRPSLHTLNVLSQFVGYDDWAHFEAFRPDSEMAPSDHILAQRLSTANMQAGERVRLTWAPQRECVIEYLGDTRFVVVASKNTRLCQGDTFACSLIIAGEPLYLDDLRQTGRQPSAYVCGQVHGVQFELLSPDGQAQI